jgi:hypothetical protein
MKGFKDTFKKMCTPAQVYLAIAFLGAFISLFNNNAIANIIVNLFFALIWTFVLSWLCKQGYENLSWFLVLLPYIILLLGILGIMKLSRMK